MPVRALPGEHAPPSGEPVLLESRYGGRNGITEIGIIRLATGRESVWAVDQGALQITGKYCIPYSQRSSWASKTQLLLFGRVDELSLINKDGQWFPLTLHLPLKKSACTIMSNFAISSDGTRVAYSVGTELFSQLTTGSEPKLLAAKGWEFHPDWHPDGTRIAFKTTEDSLVVADKDGNRIVTIPRPGEKRRTKLFPMGMGITEIRWSPDGTRLAFLFNGTLYVVDADGRDLKATVFLHDDIEIYTFAWSPTGDRFAFRSTYQAGEQCNFNVPYRLEVGRFPCLTRFLLYTSNSDGSDLKQINKDYEYSPQDLFWIQ
jgi:Tol biopolymer transport system component